MSTRKTSSGKPESSRSRPATSPATEQRNDAPLVQAVYLLHVGVKARLEEKLEEVGAHALVQLAQRNVEQYAHGMGDPLDGRIYKAWSLLTVLDRAFAAGVDLGGGDLADPVLNMLEVAMNLLAGPARKEAA